MYAFFLFIIFHEKSVSSRGRTRGWGEVSPVGHRCLLRDRRRSGGEILREWVPWTVRRDRRSDLSLILFDIVLGTILDGPFFLYKCLSSSDVPKMILFGFLFKWFWYTPIGVGRYPLVHGVGRLGPCRCTVWTQVDWSNRVGGTDTTSGWLRETKTNMKLKRSFQRICPIFSLPIGCSHKSRTNNRHIQFPLPILP